MFKLILFSFSKQSSYEHRIVRVMIINSKLEVRVVAACVLYYFTFIENVSCQTMDHQPMGPKLNISPS
jgi:hypothetical protein